MHALSPALTGRRNRLVLAHQDLVRPVARSILRRLPPSFEAADLVQAGMIGLIQAAAAFNPSRGVPFAAFARHRIRGAMLDSVRRQAWHEETHAPLAETTSQAHDVFSHIHSARLWEAVTTLPERDCQLIRMHFYEGHSLAVCGQAAGISKTRAHQLIRQALDRIGEQLAS